MKTIVSATGKDGTGRTTVTYSDGTKETLRGDRATRNNNPGNLEYNEYTRSLGAVGSDGRFAVFPDSLTGLRAKEKMLFTGKNYRDLTIKEAITRYAPPEENNTTKYIAVVTDALGVPADTKMSALTQEQRQIMTGAMTRHEGYKGPLPEGYAPPNPVGQLQEQLTQLGFNPGPVDGVFGSATKQAVKDFQDTYGLNPDGIVGPKTREALEYAAYPETPRSFPALPASPPANPSTLGGLNYSVPPAPAPMNAPVTPVDRGALPPLAPAALLAEAYRQFQQSPVPANIAETLYNATQREGMIGQAISPPRDYQTDNRASQAMFDALPQDTYLQDRFNKAQGLSPAARMAPTDGASLRSMSDALRGSGQVPAFSPSSPFADHGLGLPQSFPGSKEFTPSSPFAAQKVAEFSPSSPFSNRSLGAPQAPTQSPFTSKSNAVAFSPSSPFSAGLPAARGMTPTYADPRAEAYASLPPAPVMASKLDRIDIPNSAKPAAPAISPATLAAQYAAYGAGKVAPTQTAASATQATPKPSQAIAQKAALPPLQNRGVVAQPTVTPYTPPAAPQMNDMEAAKMGLVPNYAESGKKVGYMPSVAANPAQVLKDQMGLIARNPIQSIGQMIAGSLLGGVFFDRLPNLFSRAQAALPQMQDIGGGLMARTGNPASGNSPFSGSGTVSATPSSGGSRVQYDNGWSAYANPTTGVTTTFNAQGEPMGGPGGGASGK